MPGPLQWRELKGTRAIWGISLPADAPGRTANSGTTIFLGVVIVVYRRPVLVVRVVQIVYKQNGRPVQQDPSKRQNGHHRGAIGSSAGALSAVTSTRWSASQYFFYYYYYYTNI